MRESGVDLGTIGLFALVATPYTLKFLWAPITDALDVPLLSRLLAAAGRLAGVHANSADGAIVSSDRAIRPRRQRWSRSARCWWPRVRHAGHRGRRLPRREPAGERTGRRHGVLRRAYRIGMLVRPPARYLVSGLETWGSPSSRLALGLHLMAALVLIGTSPR